MLIVIWVDPPLFKSNRRPTRLRLLWIIDNASLPTRYVLCNQLGGRISGTFDRSSFLRITPLAYPPPRLRLRTHLRLTNFFLQAPRQPLERSLDATELPLCHRPLQILYRHLKIRLRRQSNHEMLVSLIYITACR